MKPTYRASMLNKLRDCSGYITLVDRVPKEGNEYCRRGTLAHEWLADRIGGLPAGNCSQHLTDIERKINDEDMVANLYNTLRIWQNSDYYFFFDASEQKLVEKKIEVETPNYILTGHVDLAYIINRELHIFDWKSGGNLLGPMDGDLQMDAYVALIANEYQGDLDLNGYAYKHRVVLDRPETFEPLRVSIYGAISRVNLLCNALANSQPKFTCGSHCSHCLAAEVCDTYQSGAHQLVQYSPDVDITSARDVARIHQAIGPAAALLEAAKKAVREWHKTNGDCEYDGYRYGLQKYSMEKIGNIDLIEQLLPEAIEIKRSTSKSRIKRVCEQQGFSSDEVKDLFCKLAESGAYNNIECKKLYCKKV